MRLVVQNEPLPAVDDIKEYTFTDEDSGHQLTIQGTVRWVRKGSPLTRRAEIGIEFVNLPPSHRDALLHLAVLGQLVISNDPNAPQATDEEQTNALELNLYEVFSISPYATDGQIKAAFHKLAKKWHPDHNNSKEAPARMEELHKAYSILKDPILRARYDTRFEQDHKSDSAAA